ncbi:MAG: hypothetical protein JWO05_1153 [Gemmatimonadetes bacterium]|nr:hypothetical protein [Gemmatimonadota bacterium]
MPPLNPSAGFSSASFLPDQLLAIDTDYALVEKVTLLAGQNLTRGAVLGRTATAAVVAAAVADAGNTGNGVFGAATIGATVKPGRYRIVCIEPAANAGVFAIFEPGGAEIGRANVGVAFVGAINFTIADGATDFISGDTFSVDVSAVVYKYKLATAAAVDGSDLARAILTQDADATAGDVECLIYTRGNFNDTQIVLGAGHTIASVKDSLRANFCFLIHGQPA